MRNFILLVLAVFTVNLATASFPVKRSNSDVEVVAQTTVSENVSANEMAFTAASGSDFHIGGFALGFLLGLLGVVLAYIFSKNQSLRKSSWYGLLAVVILVLLL